LAGEVLMDADQWAEVFEAGANAVSGIDMLREEALPESLYGVAAVKRALEAMEQKAREISER
jgi:hypothetical protein